MSEIDRNEARGRLRGMMSLRSDLSANDREAVGVVLAELARLEHLLSLPTVPASEHQRVQAEAAALLKEVEEWASPGQGMGSGLHAEKWPPLSRAARAEMKALLARCSSAGAALLEEMEGLRRERDDLRAIPSGLFDALEATTTALEAAGLRSDLTKLARAVMRGEPEVLRAYRAESADLRSRLESAEGRVEFLRSELDMARTFHPAAEVRRAVEAEREQAARTVETRASRAYLPSEPMEVIRRELLDAASAIRARGKEPHK